MPDKKINLLNKNIKIPKFETIIFDKENNPHFIVPVSEYIPLTKSIFASTLNTCKTTEVINKSLNKYEDSILIQEMDKLLVLCPEFEDKLNEYKGKVAELINSPTKTFLQLMDEAGGLQYIIDNCTTNLDTFHQQIDCFHAIQDAQTDQDSDNEGVYHSEIQAKIQAIQDKITDAEDIIQNLTQKMYSLQKTIGILSDTINGHVTNYYFDTSKIITSVSDKNKAMYMNYVGYESWDVNGVNTNKELSIIDRFLKDIDTNGKLYNNRGLSVLINKDDIQVIGDKFRQLCKTYYSNIPEFHKELENKITNEIKNQISTELSIVKSIDKEKIDDIEPIVKDILNTIIDNESLVAQIWDDLKKTLATSTNLSLHELAYKIQMQTYAYSNDAYSGSELDRIYDFFEDISKINMIIEKLEPCSTEVLNGMTDESKENIILQIFNKWNDISDENYKGITGDLLVENYKNHTSFERLNIAISNDVYEKLKGKNRLLEISSSNDENLATENPEYYSPTNYLQILFGSIMQEHYTSSTEDRKKLFENFSNYIETLKTNTAKTDGDIFKDIINKIFYGTGLNKDIKKIKQNVNREYELLGGALHATQVEKLDLHMNDRTFSDGFFKENSGVFYVPLDEILKQYEIEVPKLDNIAEFKINNFKLEGVHDFNITTTIDSLLSIKSIKAFETILMSNDLSLEDKVDVLKLVITDKKYKDISENLSALDLKIRQELLYQLLNTEDFINSIIPQDFHQIFHLIRDAKIDEGIVKKTIFKILDNETFIDSITPQDFCQIFHDILISDLDTFLSVNSYTKSDNEIIDRTIYTLLDNKDFIDSIKPQDFHQIFDLLDRNFGGNEIREVTITKLLHNENFINSIRSSNFSDIFSVILEAKIDNKTINDTLYTLLHNENFIDSITSSNFYYIFSVIEKAKVDDKTINDTLYTLLKNEIFINSIKSTHFSDIFSIILDAGIDKEIVQEPIYKLLNNETFINSIKYPHYSDIFSISLDAGIDKEIVQESIYKLLNNEPFINSIDQYNFSNIFNVILRAEIDNEIVQDIILSIFNNENFIDSITPFYFSEIFDVILSAGIDNEIIQDTIHEIFNTDYFILKLIEYPSIYNTLMQDERISEDNKKILKQLIESKLPQDPQQPHPQQIQPAKPQQLQPPQPTIATVPNPEPINTNREPSRE